MDRTAAAAAFAAVWVVGMILSFVSTRLAISGTLWDLGVPGWLIALTVQVGLWQWMWLGPLLRLVRRQHRHALYRGLLLGGLSFSVLHLTAWIALFFLFRNLSLH